MIENELNKENLQTSSAWTVDTLRVFFSQQITDLRDMLQERYVNQTKAVDAAFSSQQIAMQTAKTEQATAMNTALAVQKEAVQTAMAAADKATAKAETAADKRFEESNGYRQQLMNQAGTFATRDELDLRINTVQDKLGYETQRLLDAGSVRDKAISEVNMRLTTQAAGSAGKDLGEADSRSNRRLDTSQVISFGSLLLVLISVAVTLFTVLSK